MNPPRSLRRWLVCSAILIGGLAVIAVLVLRERGNDKANGHENDTGEPVAKGDPNEAAKMVDAIVNRNQEPKLVNRPSGWPREIAMFPESYDWAEDARVLRALDKLFQDRTLALWEELVRRGDDPRYCVTLVSVQNEDAQIISVTGVCFRLAYSHLVDVFKQHLPVSEDADGRKIALDIGIENLAEWRKKRANKSLYELQIEVCENALSQVSKAKGVSEDDEALARGKIKGEIARLKRTKQPFFVPYRRAFFPYLGYGYTPGIAKRIREAVKSGSSEQIIILK